ncbi:MAG: ATP-binding cassette domain-containing protein, partial [Gammaproteobacteria bacterium]
MSTKPITLCFQQLSVGNAHTGFRLRDISNTFYAGEVTALIGPNGSGKSTLLSVASTQLTPQSGSLTLCGKKSSDWSARERAQRVAHLPQHQELNFAFTVEEVVQLGRQCHTESTHHTRQIARQYGTALDITTLWKRDYTSLSGGEKQRVHVARVLAQVSALDPDHQTPRLLLLDEPTNSLDLTHQALLIDKVKQAAQYGVTTIMSLHDLNRVSPICDAVICLQ